VANGWVGVVALVAISACMSLMFPTIYGLAADGLGEDRKIGGALLIMAIHGGAVLTAAQGQLSDAFGIHIAYLVPLIWDVIFIFRKTNPSSPLPSGASDTASPSSGS
jgi:FHS family L-fucose permease-like MFS transporter